MAHVLVVDDEKSIRITLREFLWDEGHQVKVAEDAEEAMALLKAENFDVVVTDIILPKITGVDLLRSIRKESPHVQVIMMTGEPTVDTASAAVREGAFDYLPKPVSSDIIVRTVANAAKVKFLNDDRSRLEEDNRRYQENLEQLVEERTNKLQESEELFRKVFEEGQLGVALTTIDYRYLKANKRFCEMLGYTEEELIQLTFPEITHPDDIERDLELVQKKLSGELRANKIEKRFIRKNKEIIWVALSVGVIHDKNGKNKYGIIMADDITSRKQAQEILRQSETRYRSLFEDSPVSFWEEDFSDVKVYIDSLRGKGVSDLRSYFDENPEIVKHCSNLVKILDINKVGLDLYKAESKEELYRGLASVFTDRALEVFKEELIELSKGKTTFHSEIIGRTLKGDLLQMDLFLTIVPGYEESWGKVFVSDIDITERKRMEEELKARTRQQEAIAKLGHTALTDVRREDLFNEIVCVTSEILNVDLCKILEVIPDTNSLLLRAGIGWKEGLVGTAIVNAELDSQAGFTLLSKEAVVVEDLRTEKRFSGPALLTDHKVISGMSVIIGEREHPYGVLGTHTTERRVFTRDDMNFLEAVSNLLAEVIKRANLEEEQKRLAAAVEQAVEIIVITNSRGSIQYVNPAFRKITGYSSGEIQGRNPRTLKSGKHPASFYKEMWGYLVRGEIWKGRVVNKRKNGTLFTADLTISPIRDKTGEIISYVGVSKDVSQEIEIENKLIQAQKMEAIGTLAGGIAHDFNNMLCVINGYSHLGVNLLPEDDKFNGYFQSINTAGTRAGDLVKQILTFSRQSEKNLEALLVVPLIKEAIKFLRASLPTTIEINQNITQDCGKILADPTQIHQVIMNLCTNAGYAMREKGGVLTIRLTEFEISDTNLPKPGMECGEYLQLTIEDTGSGIPKEVLERIFDPFYTTKPIGEGTGMGLSVVHGIVEDYGGAVLVESKLGEGTKFELFLPLVQDVIDSKAVAVTSAPNGSESILFVDDEEMLVQMEKEMAESLGYDVTVATTSWQALEIFESETDKFDLVITDQTMPGMTGVELAREIWGITPDIPIILTTGYSHTIDEEQAMDMGFSDFFKKPLDRKILGSTIRKVLDKSKLNNL